MTEPARQGMTVLVAALDRISVAELRRRGGLKWTYAGPDVLGAFVAEMDFGTSPAVEAALRDVIARRDFGYPAPAAVQEMEMAEVVAALVKVLSSRWLLDQLASLPGYDPARCGELIATLPPLGPPLSPSPEPVP